MSNEAALDEKLATALKVASELGQARDKLENALSGWGPDDCYDELFEAKRAINMVVWSLLQLL